MSILITYAEEGGESTLIVRLAIAHELINAGHDVDLYPCDRAPQVRDYDAVVVGSMIKHRRWQAEAVSFLRRNAADLADRPTVSVPDRGNGPRRPIRACRKHHASDVSDRHRRTANVRHCRDEPRRAARAGRGMGTSRSVEI